MAPRETRADVLTRHEHVAARTDELVAMLPDLSATQPLPEAPWHEPGATRARSQPAAMTSDAARAPDCSAPSM